MKIIYEHLLDYCVREEIISENDMDYYKYRFEMLEGELIHILIIIFNCFISKYTSLFLTYTIAYYFLRIRTGGYHADSKLKCFLMSAGWYFLINLIVIPYIAENDFEICIGILVGIAVVITWIMAPVNHPNLSLNKDEYNRLKRLVHLTLFFEVIVAIIVGIINRNYFNSIAIAIITGATFIIISKILKQEVEIHEGYQEDGY